MNVLSLFDGMSCGQIALERAGIPIENYFASEIDKYAIKVTQANYPNTIQLGNVTDWKSWELPKIDLLIAGSPCQGFSLAGKGLNFDDPRSQLFFVFLSIRDELLRRNPDLFWMLENVKMKKEWSEKITELVGIAPVLIDSALVSAQSRKRLYWANFPIEQPKDLGILLKDIIEDGDVDREKSYCVDANYAKGGNPNRYVNKSSRQLVKLPSMVQVGMADDIKGFDVVRRIYSSDGKSPALTSMQGGRREPKIYIQGGALRNQVVKGKTEFQLNVRKDNKSNAVVSSFTNRLNGWYDGVSYRKLTVLECERLQTVSDGYTNHVSNSQRYKMLGNGWTVDVIANNFKYIKENKPQKRLK